uniref:non-specific serine/threonine protein kinase n=1 Tax=Mougeotia scalaris TaxID=13158 RepID=Q401Q7_MOUSC|nr:neochrome [Mougeotia scalaris]BAE20163.1 neochrome [Mougeotia scalaris]
MSSRPGHVRNDIRPIRGPSRLSAQANLAAERQDAADAFIQSNYEKAAAGKGEFNYKGLLTTMDGRKPWEVDQMAYLAKMRRSGLGQPYGAMIVVEPPLRHAPKLHLLAYSENVAELLGVDPKEVGLGKNAIGFFSDSSGMVLYREASSRNSFQQPLVLHLRNKPVDFYAILHRGPEGILIDLEPVFPEDKSLSVATLRGISGDRDPTAAITMTEAKESVSGAIRRLQNLPSGSVLSMCQAVVEEVRDLLQYDRVMVYKFHPDQHGEVFAESVRDDMEPFLGLHYPSTDLPQAIRMLLMRVGSRMICDASRPMVKIVQPEVEEKSVDLSESTLRAPHGCHVQYMCNMGSMASITTAIMADERKDDLDPHESSKNKRLWGLIVGHHCGARYTPYPMRKAIEHLAQQFGLLLDREISLAANFHEENILNMQKKLCDMLESNIPLGIVKNSPSIMDLVKCDGAALLFADRFWLLGATPTERQVFDIAEWILKAHGKRSALCTDSLAEAGFPGAADLGEKTCGLVAIKIGPQDFVFWFRSHTAKEVRWGGRRQVQGEIDDDNKLMPRNSFQAFLDVVKKRCLPWEDIELEAINGLRLLLNETLENSRSDAVSNLEGGTDVDGNAMTTRVLLTAQRSIPKPVSALTEEVEVVLACFKTSFLVTDATKEDYPVIFCSEAFSLLSGYKAEDLLGGSCRKLEGYETDELEVSRFLEALEAGSQYSGRQLHYKSDGSPFWDLVTSAAVQDEFDNVVNHVIVYQEVAKYAEGQLPQGKPSIAMASPSTEKGFPVSLIRYDGRLKEKSTRKVNEIVQAMKNPSRAKVDGPLTPGRQGGIAEELKIPMPASPDFSRPQVRHGSIDHSKPSVKPARRRSVVDILMGKPKEEAEAARRGAVSTEEPKVSMDGSDSGKKRRAAKGIDFGTTLERIEYSFLVTDPRLDENPIIFMSDEYIRLTAYTREEHIGGELIYLDGDNTSTSDVRKIRSAAQNNKELSMQFLAYKKNGDTFWALYHFSMVKDSDGTVLYIVNVVKDLGKSMVDDAAFKKAVAKAEKEASSVAEALRDLPDAASEERQWTIHSRAVLPKPHKVEDPAWAAIKKVRAEEGRLGLKHFKPIKPLGNGDSGSVMLVELRGTGQLFAVKVMEKESMIERNKVHRVASEREILDNLDHPFLPTLYASFQTAKHVCFVTDFCPGGELYDFLEVQPGHRFEEKVAQFYAAEILLALEYLHCKGVVYRDLKPENILLTNGGHVVLTDFDLSVLSSTFPKVLRDTKGKRGRSRRPSKEPHPTFVAEPVTRSNSFVGTEEYIAPEIVTGAGHNSSIDWWSFGILLYEMLFGHTPFCGSSMRKTFSNILNREVFFPPEVNVSAEAKDLITLLLVKDADQRLGSKSGAAEIKVHKFFANIDWPLIRFKATAVPKVPVRLDNTVAPSTNAEGGASLENWRLQEVPSGVESARSSGSYLRDSIGSPYVMGASDSPMLKNPDEEYGKWYSSSSQV